MHTFEAKLPRNLRKQDPCDMKQTLNVCVVFSIGFSLRKLLRKGNRSTLKIKFIKQNAAL